MKRLDLEKEFKNPSSQYRSLPFWAWNDKMEIDEIKRQIREMKSCGMGGFFMHSRDGLETEYLSDEWFECIKAAVDEAKANDMQAWLYDEDRWPSGSCGGKVSAGAKKGCKGLTLEVCDEVCEEDNILAVYAAKIDGMEIYSLRRIGLEDGVNENERLLVARLELSEPSQWFNNSSPPDNLSRDEVSEFISLTHEKYKACIGDEMGKTVKGIFTDEPSLADRHASFNPQRGWIPWTYGFEEYYRQKRNADIFDTLPYIYFNHENSKKARHDYWNTVSEMFLESYSEQISDWCRENNIAYTGHFLQEDRLGLCCRVSGGIMPHYMMQDVPAIDMLTERTEEYLTVRQCVSVANQLGRESVLSEMYGCTGWDFSFEGQKHIGEWQYVLGVNHRCQHLALYSLRGCRKRDYPPSMNCNVSWWKHYKAVEDYFARIGYMISCGKAVSDILIIHPMTTVWSNMGCNPYGNPVRKNERDIPAMDELGYRLNELIKELTHRHYSCDLGDESIIAGYGSSDSQGFIVGECRYKAVIIPYCETLLKSTLEMLIEFAKCGGRVISLKPHVSLCEAQDSELVDKLKSQAGYVEVDLPEKIYGFLPDREFSFTDGDGNEIKDILYQLRREKDGYILYLVNNSRDNSYKVNICTAIQGNIYRANPMNGEIYGYDVSDGFVEYIPQCGSLLFYITEKEIPCERDRGHNCVSIREKALEIPLRLVRYENSSPNVLTLDKCRYIMDGVVSEEKEVWKAQCEIREKLGMRQIHRNGLEQRYRWIGEEHENNGKEVTLEFTFESLCEIKGAELVIERPDCFEIKLDSTAVENTSCGYFFDKSFECIKLPDITKGVHVLSLKCSYRNDYELENCYIKGEFGVNTERKLTDKPESIELGDIGEQGFFHYAGDMKYYFECEIDDADKEIYLDVRDFDGICAAISVNDEKQAIPWRAAAVPEIGALLKRGKNEITVTVCAGMRNMLGPLHLKEKERVTKDVLFCSEGEKYTDEYVTVKTGLNKVRLF